MSQNCNYLFATGLTSHFIGPVRYDLVDIHVGLCAATSLPYFQRKVDVQLARFNLKDDEQEIRRKCIGIGEKKVVSKE